MNKRKNNNDNRRNRLLNTKNILAVGKGEGGGGMGETGEEY